LASSCPPVISAMRREIAEFASQQRIENTAPNGVSASGQPYDEELLVEYLRSKRDQALNVAAQREGFHDLYQHLSTTTTAEKEQQEAVTTL
jgi:hypothetical protein